MDFSKVLFGVGAVALIAGGSLVVGSETRKVLTHSSIPVLVFRDDELAVTG